MSFWSSLFAPGETARGAALDAQLQADHAAKLASGAESQANYDTYLAHAQNSPATAYDAQIGEAFVEGAQEGLAAEQAAVKGTLTGTLQGALGFVPWWLWVVALGWLGYQLGLFDFLKRKLARA